MVQQAIVGQAPLIIEASAWHLVRLLWTSDQPNADLVYFYFCNYVFNNLNKFRHRALM